MRMPKTSLLVFAMHPDDEAAFAKVIVSEPSVWFIDGPHWKSPEPVSTRSFADIAGDYCIVWRTTERDMLSVRPAPGGGWFCDSEEITLQFMRSRIRGSVITTGSIAAHCDRLTNGEARRVDRRFNNLERFIRGQYASREFRWHDLDVPAGQPEPPCWVGPRAQAWLQEDPVRRIEQSPDAPVEA